MFFKLFLPILPSRFEHSKMTKKPTFCKKCRRDFRRPYNLTLHKKVAHSHMVAKVVCPICVEKGSNTPQKCSNLSNLKKHIEREHAKHQGKKTIRSNRYNGKKLEYKFYEKSKLNNGRVVDSDDSDGTESSMEEQRLPRSRPKYVIESSDGRVYIRFTVINSVLRIK